MIIALVFAVLAPFIYSASNTLDKYVVVHKVRHPISFTIIAGMTNIVYGLALAWLLDWSSISAKSIWIPALAGLLMGVQMYFYYFILKREDVSHIVGLVYVYPLIIALLSFLFLHEVIPVIGYIGMALVIVGAVLLSIRAKKTRLQVGFWMILVMICTVGFYEFFVKVATIKIPLWHGVCISTVFLGLATLPGFFHQQTRKGFVHELRNVKWALISESLTFAAVSSMYLAMAGLPATIVASIGAMQPLIVLVFERLMHRRVGEIVKDTAFLPKLVPITTVVFGVILLYLSQL